MRLGSRFAHVVGSLATAAALLCAAAAFGCTPATPHDQIVNEAATSAGVSRAEVAAVAEGRVITQSQVDARVWAFRVRNDLESDEAYQRFLDERGYQDWDVRARAIKNLIDEALIAVEAERLGVVVEEGEVRTLVRHLSSRYPTHDSWQEALAENGYNDQSYSDAVHARLLEDAVRDAVIPDASPTDEQIAEYAVVVAPTLVGRRSSQILFAATDEALAEEVRAMLDDGADFAEMVRTYSIDVSAASGGDMGWDCMNIYAEQYQEALDELDVGEISGVVRSSFGYHIIMCTDRYDAALRSDGSIDLDAVPAELMEQIRSSMMTSIKQQTFRTYVGNLEARATVAVFNADGQQIEPEDIGLATREVDIVAAETDSYEGMPSVDDELDVSTASVDELVPAPSGDAS